MRFGGVWGSGPRLVQGYEGAYHLQTLIEGVVSHSTLQRRKLGKETALRVRRVVCVSTPSEGTEGALLHSIRIREESGISEGAMYPHTLRGRYTGEVPSQSQ